MTEAISRRVASAIKRISEEQACSLLDAAIQMAAGYFEPNAEIIETPLYESDEAGKSQMVGYKPVQRKGKLIKGDPHIMELLLCNLFQDLVRKRTLEVEAKNPLTLDQNNSPQMIRQLAGKLAEFANELDKTKTIDATVVEPKEIDNERG